MEYPESATLADEVSWRCWWTSHRLMRRV